MFSSNATQVSADKLYADDVFSTHLYTGNGSTLPITNGIDLAGKGGLVWIKNRAISESHLLKDTARGSLTLLSTDSTAAEIQNNYGVAYGGFNSNGFTAIGDTYNYASWTFRKAPKFFDVVTWPGNGVNGRKIAHSLSVVPGCVIVKKTSAADSWLVKHRSLPDQTLILESTGAAYSNTEVSNINASSFTVDSGSNVNANGATYVAYLFAHDAGADGLIQCGSFTTDASGNATVSSIGWEPQFALIKASYTTGDWLMLDSMRGWNLTANDAVLKANSSGAESTTTEYGNPTATGFEFKGGSANTTYVYVVIRRPNKPPTTGTQVFNLQADPSSQSSAITAGVSDASARKVDFVLRAFRGGNTKNFEIYDRVRGFQSASSDVVDGYTSPRLTTSSTSAEVVAGTDVYQRSGVSGVEDFVRFSSATTNSVNYAFKRAPGFFDVVAYTGDGVAGRTVPHNLGVVPELMIIRERGVIYGTGQWVVYANFPGDHLRLNSNQGWQGISYFNSTAPTKSVFSVSANGNVNGASGNYIAYLFASLKGISKVGSYTGNGSSQTINCGFASGARFILIKRTDATGDWYVWDSALGIVAANDPHLSLNTAAAEVTTDDSVDPDNSGFIVNQNTATNINVLGGTYLYLAIA